MNFVDFGNCERVPLANVRPLLSNDDQLSKIPHQVTDEGATTGQVDSLADGKMSTAEIIDTYPCM